MKMTGILLARVNYPLYVVKILTERHILVAGGGGEAKTGVANSIEIYELIKNKNKNSCRAERIAYFDTGKRAVMNATVYNSNSNSNNKIILFSGGLNGLCVIYEIKLIVESNKLNDDNICKNSNSINLNSNGSIKCRKSTSNKNIDKNNVINKERDLIEDDNFKLSFEINPLTSFQADFNDNIIDSYLKVLVYSSQANLLITGGSDGIIRCFESSDFKMIFSIPAHKNEITGLDIDSSGFKLISISRDLHSYIWDLKTKNKLTELNHGQNKIVNGEKVKYDFRGCVFGIVENDINETSLFTVHNPPNKVSSCNKSFICKWNTKTFNTSKIVYSGTDNFSTITISEDGRFIGVGMSSGAVGIYIAFSLQRIYLMPNSHQLFVTNVQFLACSKEAQMVTGNYDASLVSVSVDNHIVIHHIPKQITIGFLNSSIIFTIFMLIIYVLLDYLGL